MLSWCLWLLEKCKVVGPKPQEKPLQQKERATAKYSSHHYSTILFELGLHVELVLVSGENEMQGSRAKTLGEATPAKGETNCQVFFTPP